MRYQIRRAQGRASFGFVGSNVSSNPAYFHTARFRLSRASILADYPISLGLRLSIPFAFPNDSGARADIVETDAK